MAKEFGYVENLYTKGFERLNFFLTQYPVGTDIDNSEVATNACGIKVVNRILRTDITLADIKYDFAIVDLIKERAPWVKDSLQMALDIWNSREVQTSALPFAGQWLLADFLHKQKVLDFHRITSRPKACKDATLEWYRKWLPWVDESRIHMQTGDEVNSTFKVEEIDRLGIKLFFEDTPKHAEEIIAGTAADVVLIPQLANASYIPKSERIITVPEAYMPHVPGWFRVYSWLARNYT